MRWLSGSRPLHPARSCGRAITTSSNAQVAGTCDKWQSRIQAPSRRQQKPCAPGWRIPRQDRADPRRSTEARGIVSRVDGMAIDQVTATVIALSSPADRPAFPARAAPEAQ